MELPDGAVVTEFCLSAVVVEVPGCCEDYPIAANLYKTNLDTGGAALIARTFTPAGGPTGAYNVCIDSNEVVNNNKYAYSARVNMNYGRLIGVRIKYQVTQLP